MKRRGLAPRRPFSRLSAAGLLTLVFAMAFTLAMLLLSMTPPPHAVPVDTHNPAAADDRLDRPLLTLDDATNSFTLVIFSDLHFGEEESGWGIEQDLRSAAVMRAVLAREEPRRIGLAVLNGDLITGENTFRENASDYVHAAVAPLAAARVPWASTYGNHDSKFNLSREDVLAAEAGYPLSYTRRMDPSLPGVTNYFLLLHRPHVKGSTSPPPAVAVLWFFDSRGGATYQNSAARDQDRDDIPNWVSPETASWFRAASARLRARHGALPSLAFVHIPPHPFLTAQRAGLDPSRFPGVNDDVPLAVQGSGAADDGAFADALRAEEGLHSVYVGHDHGNAWCALWPEEEEEEEEEEDDEGNRKLVFPRSRRRHEEDEEERPGGPFLCFSKHTGYGGYGTWNRGARVVRLDFPDPGEMTMRVRTWVRMEDGAAVTAVALNDTYGLDEYPTADGE